MSPELLYALACWVSDTWYEHSAPEGRGLYYRARGIVVFDRVLNGEIERHNRGMNLMPPVCQGERP